MLLLCYSLIDTNTIPFYFSLSQIGRAEPRNQRLGLTVSFRRFPSSLLRVLSHGRNIYFYFADASARTSSDTASTCRASILLYYRTKVIECFVILKRKRITHSTQTTYKTHLSYPSSHKKNHLQQ